MAMSTAEVIEGIEKLPLDEQKKVFAFLAQKVIASEVPEARQWLGRKLSFDEACDVVFRENRQLLALLAK